VLYCRLRRRVYSHDDRLASHLILFQSYYSNKQDLVALSNRLDMLEKMEFPNNIDAKAVGRDKLLPCVTFSADPTSTSHSVQGS
jgi:hypothetical protein